MHYVACECSTLLGLCVCVCAIIMCNYAIIHYYNKYTHNLHNNYNY